MVEATITTAAGGYHLDKEEEWMSPLLTDHYQLTMCYAYWKNNRHEESAVFEAFFRKNPFKGKFTVFAGIEEVIKYVATFHFKPEHIAYLRT